MKKYEKLSAELAAPPIVLDDTIDVSGGAICGGGTCSYTCSRSCTGSCSQSCTATGNVVSPGPL